MLRRLVGYRDALCCLRYPVASFNHVLNRQIKSLLHRAQTTSSYSTMPSRARQSTAEPAQAQRRGAAEFSPYEKPAFPLNPAAQRALEQLARARDLQKLNDQLEEAKGALATTAGEINDRLTNKEQALNKRKDRRERNGSAQAEGQDELERNLDEFKDKVARMTQRMDESMRKMIDAQHSVQAVRESLASTHRDARENANTQATLQQERTQYEDFQPTDPAAGTQDVPAPIDLFRAKYEDAKLRYQSNSLTARYAYNNSYRDFRRVVHDARHPDGDVQLPHHDDWFEDGPAPPPGTAGGVAADDDDSDVDIAVSRAKISTTCPLTLAEFKQPLKSALCPHSFEKDAILGLIKRSPARDAGRGNVQVNQCPVPGCDKMLAAADLHEDAVLIRQIKRLQAAKEREQEDADDDGEEGQRPTVIDDGDDAEDVDDVIAGRSTQARVKKEPRTQKSVANVRSTPGAASGNGVTLIEVDDEESDDDATMSG
jgi:E3 SUMO-protein ligase NSE2